MEGLTSFITIVLAIWGVLEIILFFKIWGMTNNVQMLTTKLCRTAKDFNIRSEVHKLHILGKDEEAKVLLDEQFVASCAEIFIQQHDESSEEYSKSSYELHVGNLIVDYEKLYKAIGYEMPEAYKTLGYEDFKSFAK